MPALKPTGFAARIAWIGRVGDRDGSLASSPAERLALGFDGLEGESHGGALRPACSRVSAQHRRGTPIRNVRQLSVVSEEELAETAAVLGLERLEPAWIGATLCLAGLPHLSLLPPSSRLQGPDGATLVIDMQNRPCHLPDPVIRAATGRDRLAASFRKAAANRRGVTAWVEREGVLELGQELRLHVPDQPAWPHLSEARGVSR
ncbi:sulfurase [Poseidonocella sp. HB161398]|uniref:MOSC domain-containing protein n=1 Tax=Poseidonocella sp. HB161398 TaxID=2320855 RepID=UPI00110957BB|nr:sulfurase [Poseidonocella sp. HB161398]